MALPWNCVPARAALAQKVQVCAEVRLLDSTDVEARVARRGDGRRRRRAPHSQAPRELIVGDVKVESSSRNVELDEVPRADDGERPPRRALRRNVKHDGPESSARHAAVRDADHVLNARREDLAREGQVADLRAATWSV